MPDQQPPPWFKDQDKGPDDTFKKRKKQLEQELPKLLERQKKKGRADSFLPYLLIRSVMGDRGDRPINVPFWESPDIWTAPGDPSTSPDVPPDHGGTLDAGQPNTVYAHVWNLGFAPLAGIFVEFYWCNPSLGIDGSHAHLIGTARCELAGRGMPGSHALVKCPTAWVPVVENGGHECLVVRAYGIGDPLGANDWQPWLNRHVAQRNVSVVGSAQSWMQLMTHLIDVKGAHLTQLLQIGPQQGEFAVRMVAGRAQVSKRIVTQVLAELNVKGELVLERPRTVPAGMRSPFHPLTAGGAPRLPAVKAPGTVAVADTARLLGNAGRKLKPRSPGAQLATLLTGVKKLQPRAKVLGPPARNEAYVLRIARYDPNGQLNGGYTVVVPGR
jgi:hypothetical protein